MPTFSPRSRKPSARLTAVVDLPTPPLPDATAMMALTPGMPAGDGAPGVAAPARGRATAGGICGRGALPPFPPPLAGEGELGEPARSAVSAIMTDLTPGTARIAI